MNGFNFIIYYVLNQTSRNHAANLKFIKDMEIPHAFQNIETCLQIFLTASVTNCLSEQLFSSLKINKNKL